MPIWQCACELQQLHVPMCNSQPPENRGPNYRAWPGKIGLGGGIAEAQARPGFSGFAWNKAQARPGVLGFAWSKAQARPGLSGLLLRKTGPGWDPPGPVGGPAHVTVSLRLKT